MQQAFSFIRWSRAEQAKGDTLRRQTQLTESLCKRHGWQLTELEPLRGRSAFKGMQRATGPLAEFVKLAEAGRIKKGSVLIVESLDRLTREEIRTAVKFLIGILDAGVSVATTNPEYIFHHDGKNDLQDIMIAVVILSRGHEESATKSRRLKEAWATKRQAVEATKMTKTCPAWLKLSKDRQIFMMIPEAVAVVRRIFKLATEGYGVFRITRILNKDKVPTFGNKPRRKAARWYESYVIRILRNRAVLGEFQPCIREGSKSKPCGAPIKDYYPAVVTTKTFIAARKAIESRALGCKRTGRDVPNIFGKLIRNARDHSGFLYIPAKKKAPQPRLEPVGGRNGASLPLSFQYAPLEAAFLKFLSEITPADLAGEPKTESKADDLNARIDDLTQRIEQLKSRLDIDPDLSFLLDRLSTWDKERKALVKELEAEQHTPDEAATLAEAQSVIELIQTDPEHYRTKLRQLIRNIVTEMWMLVFEYRTEGSRGRTIKARVAILQIFFKAGYWRTLVVHRKDVKDAMVLEDSLIGFEDLRTYRDNPNTIEEIIQHRDKWSGPPPSSAK